MVATDEQILDAIKAYIDIYGYSPSMRDIGTIVGIKSASAVKSRFEHLRKKGLVTFGDNMPRTIRVVGNGHKQA